MNTPTKTTIPPEFAPSYVPYSYKGQPVKGAFGANTRPSFVKASDRAYFEADNTLSDAMRQLLIAMDVLDTGAGMKPVGDFNYCNIKARRGQSGRLGKDDVEGSLDPYANYASHVDFARAKLQLIQHPRWGVNLATDTPSEVIDKIEGTPIVWGTLFSPAAQRALETGRGIDDLKFDYEKAIVKRYRALGITDIQSARKKYYCEKMTAIGRQVGQMMAGGDPNVTYTPDFERKAHPIPPLRGASDEWAKGHRDGRRLCQTADQPPQKRASVLGGAEPDRRYLLTQRTFQERGRSSGLPFLLFIHMQRK